MSARVITIEGIAGRVGGLGPRFTFTPDDRDAPSIAGEWVEMHVGSIFEQAEELRQHKLNPIVYLQSPWVTVRMYSGESITYRRLQ